MAVDIIVVGAGTAGMPAAIEAVHGGARVVVVEQTRELGGTLKVSAGQMSGAGSALQRSRCISDSPSEHVADAKRISRDTCDAALVAKAAELAGETIDWLMEHGFDMDPSCPAILHLHEAYRTARTYWGRDGGRSILNVLRPLFEKAMSLSNAELRLGVEVVDFLADRDGAVTGVRLRDLNTGCEEDLMGGAVILATGGYGGNPEMFSRLTNGQKLYSPALASSTGRGIAIAEKLGAQIRGAEHFIPTFAGIEEADSPGKVVWDHLPSLTPQVRQPWEVFVGRDGKRFVCEDIDSVDARERALMGQPGLIFWAVFDEAIWRDAPPLLPGWTKAELEAAWSASPSFAMGRSVSEISEKTGIDAAGLAATLAEYSAAVERATPDPFGRQHRPRSIGSTGLRAIRMCGIVLKTPAGLAVNADLNVLRSDGTPIKNLYAIGEAIGGATLSGNSFVSGMSVTPALSFGRWLGRTLAQRHIEVAS